MAAPQTLTQRFGQTKPTRDFHEHFYISLKHRYAFHTVGKAANSTVKQILYERELRNTRFAMPSVHDRMAAPLLSPYQLADADLAALLLAEDLFLFTFVRNPYSRTLSCYLDRIQDQRSRPYRELMNFIGQKPGYSPSFEEFVTAICAQSYFQQNNHWRSQYHDTLAGHLAYDFIGKQESFEADIRYVHRRIFGQPLPRPATQANASPRRTAATARLAEYWSAPIRARFEEKFERDFWFFGYDMSCAG